MAMQMKTLVKRWRLHRGFLPQELAKRAKLPAPHIHQIESGRIKEPRDTTVRKIMKALEIVSRDEFEAGPPAKKKTASGKKRKVKNDANVHG